MDTTYLCTKYSEPLFAIVKEIMDSKGATEAPHNPDKFLIYFNNAGGDYRWGAVSSVPDTYRELNLADFVSFISALRVLEKPEYVQVFIGESLGARSAFVGPAMVQIGCQRYNAENISIIEQAVDAHRKHQSKFSPGDDLKQIYLDEKGLTCNGVFISFGDYDKIMRKYKEKA